MPKTEPRALVAGRFEKGATPGAITFVPVDTRAGGFLHLREQTAAELLNEQAAELAELRAKVELAQSTTDSLHEAYGKSIDERDAAQKSAVDWERLAESRLESHHEERRLAKIALDVCLSGDALETLRRADPSDLLEKGYRILRTDGWGGLPHVTASLEDGPTFGGNTLDDIRKQITE